MALVLSILKWIGIILLAIIGIVILIILYALLLPLHYQVGVKNKPEETLSFDIKISGFLHFWQIKTAEADGSLAFMLYAFWGACRIYPFKKKTSEKSRGKEQQKTPASEDIADDDVLTEEEKAEILSDAEVDFNPKQYRMEAEEKEKEENKKKNKTKEKQAKKKTKQQKKKETGFSLGDFHKKWKDEHNKNAVMFILKKILWLLKKSKPTDLQADVDFSLGDPALTGMTTGFISLFPAAYGRKTRIIPDFQSDDIYLNGWFRIKGIVFLGHIVYLIISIICNEDCKRLWKS